MQVGSTSQAINIERRKIAWGRINPSMKTLAKETYDNRKNNLFGPRFLEKALKKIDADKALAKVVHNGSNSRKRPLEDDPKDLCPKAPQLSTAARGNNASTSHTMPTQPQEALLPAQETQTSSQSP